MHQVLVGMIYGKDKQLSGFYLPLLQLIDQHLPEMKEKSYQASLSLLFYLNLGLAKQTVVQLNYLQQT